MKKGILIVGGFVRDMLIGETSNDIDYVVVGYTTEEFMEEFPGARQIGKDFPVMLYEGEEYAFARTERSNGDCHNSFEVISHPEITLDDDLMRRDLTINTFALCPESGEMIGSPEAATDLSYKILKHTSEAFAEDPLRVFRLARFAAKLPDFEIYYATYELCQSMVDKLPALSKERVWAETRKALAEKVPSRYFKVLKNIGALEYWFKEIHACINIPAGPAEHHPEGDTFNHLMEVLDRTAEETECVYARWAAVCHDLGKAETYKELLPAHHGHEERSGDCIVSLCERLNTPLKFRSAAYMFAVEHMKIHRIWELRPGKAVTMILRLAKFNGGAIDSLTAVAKADGNDERTCHLIREACFLLPNVRLPKKYYDRGKACADILMNLRTTEWKRIKTNVMGMHR